MSGGADGTCPDPVPSFGFLPDADQNFLLGPITASGATVSNLVAVSDDTAASSGQAPTIDVVDNTTGLVVLSCTVPANQNFCTNPGSGSVPAGDYIEVRITENGFPDAQWTVTFRF